MRLSPCSWTRREDPTGALMISAYASLGSCRMAKDEEAAPAALPQSQMFSAPMPYCSPMVAIAATTSNGRGYATIMLDIKGAY